MKTGVKVVLCILALPAAISAYSLWSMAFTKPVALVDAATDTNKMLANYEWFHEASAAYDSKLAQIANQHSFIKSQDDKAEAGRLRVEMGAMQQSCRDLVAKYKAKTGEVHVGFLKSKSLPETLSPEGCE